MSLAKKLATVPFAHLLGIRAESEETEEERKEREEKEAKRAQWAEKAETDDERKRRDDEDDEEYASRMEDMDDEEAKKAKKAEHEEPDGDEDEKEKAARRVEKARCARIVAHGLKNGCVTQAAVFAFDTEMSVSAATAALDAAKLDGKGRLSEKMSAITLPKVGAEAESPKASSSDATAAAIIKAAARARGEQ